MNLIRFIAIVIAVGCFGISGCNNGDSQKDNEANTDTTSSETQDDHGHSHDEDDHSGDAHGPNNGHPIKFEAAEFAAEWLHYNANNTIRLIFLDKKCTKNQAIMASTVAIKRADGDDEVFTLDAEDADENGMATKFSIDSSDLGIAMNLGVIVEVQVGDTTYTANIAAHESHDH